MRTYVTLDENEAIIVLAALSRISSDVPDVSDFCNKIAKLMNIGELHATERLYQDMTFSYRGDTGCSFVELYGT